MSFDVNLVKELALKYALANAIKYNGKADLKAVMAKLMGEKPEFRKFAKQVKEIVEEVIDYVNSLSLEEQKNLLSQKWPEMLEEKKVVIKKDIESLPPLPNVNKFDVLVFRFAPNPDFVLTLGNARPAILNYAYKIKYEALGKKVKYILRFEDTDPKIKKPMIEAYELIKEDLKWLGIKWDEEYIQSERLEIYYEYARKLIENGHAYVCTCNTDVWKHEYRDKGKPCPCRELNPEVHLERWEKMLNGEFKEGEAVVRIKTDLNHPDPSVRDWIAFRIIDPNKNPHPYLTHKYGIEKAMKYYVWPTYNFAVAIDDYLMGITHVLRAQEHMINTIKQSYIFKYLGVKQPETIHFGRLRIEGSTLSKSKLKSLGILFNDPRLPTLAGLRERGIQPETIWDIILHVGIKQTDAIISLENLYSINRKHLESKANRYMVVINPVKLVIEDVYEEFQLKIPYHISYPERGYRIITLKPISGKIELYISRQDVDYLKRDKCVRLMEFINIEYVTESDDTIYCRIHSKELEIARKMKIQIIQWVPVHENVKVIILRPDKTSIRSKEISKDIGIGETYLLNLNKNDIVQFMRYGFVKTIEIDKNKKECTFMYIHD